MHPSERNRFEAIVSRIPDNTDRILDVGCARHTEEKRDQANLHAFIHDAINADILGIDILEEEVAKMAQDGYNVVVMDAENISFSEKFDVITAGELIEHLPNPGIFLQQARENLRVGGKLLLTTPNPDGAYYWRKALLGESNNPTHTCWIDPENLRQLTELVDGIKLKEWEYLPPVDKIGRAVWKLGRRRAASAQYTATIVKQEE